MSDDHRQLIELLFEAFNRRDASGLVALCDEEMEFLAVTAEAVGRMSPYVGPNGLREYLTDVAEVWEELLITAKEIESEGDRILVRGRVYRRSRDLGILDMPAAWIWETRDGRFISGQVFADPELAAARFTAASA
jgi:ketosteroid isomerase-like protein